MDFNELFKVIYVCSFFLGMGIIDNFSLISLTPWGGSSMRDYSMGLVHIGAGTISDTRLDSGTVGHIGN